MISSRFHDNILHSYKISKPNRDAPEYMLLPQSAQNVAVQKIFIRQGVISYDGQQNASLPMKRCAAQALHRSEELVDPYARLVRDCGNSKNFVEGKRVHGLILESEYRDNIYLANLLIQMYGKCGSLRDAHSVFDAISRPNSFSWNIMVQAYLQNGHLGGAKSMFDVMPQRNAVSWNALITGFTQKGHLEEPKGLFTRMPKWTVVSFNSIISAFAQSGLVEEAQNTFDSIPERDVVSWNALIAAYAENGQLDEAKEMFDRMPELNGTKGSCAESVHNDLERIPCRDLISWNSLLLAYAQKGHPEGAKRMFDEMPERDIVSWNTLTQAYTQNGYMVEAKNTFERIPQHDAIAWTALMRGNAQSGQFREAKRMFDRMPLRSVVPWTTMLTAYAELGHLDEAKAIFDIMPERDVVPWNALIAAYAQKGLVEEAKIVYEDVPLPNITTWNGMIAAYGQNGHLEEAWDLFNGCPLTNVVSWNTLTVAYAQNGHGKISIELFRMMNLEGVKPDELSFMSLLIACSHVGLVNDARCSFVSMAADYRITPIRDHYCCMIDILGRAGRLDDAEELINTMPFLPDVENWGSLLGACRVHLDVERSACVAAHAIELDPSNSAPYADLTSIYAALGRKEDAARVQEAMKNRGVRKNPGVSFFGIEPVGNVVE